MDLGLTDRTALVTGASRGIGRACAVSLAAEGCNLRLVARDQDHLERFAEELEADYGIGVEVMGADLSEAGERQRVLERFDIDILINNAGSIPRGGLDSLDDATWRASWELKLFGFIDLTRGYLPRMRARAAGVIVNVIGIAGSHHHPRYLAGSMANSALAAMTQALGGEYISDGVRILGVHPGLTLTDRIERRLRREAEERFNDGNRWCELLPSDPPPAKPTDIANVVTFLASGRARHVSGTVIPIDGGRSQRR